MTDTSPPLVLIHGIGLDRTIWDGMLPTLEADRQVLSYDLPGHGVVPDPLVEPTLRAFADHAVTVMDDHHIDRAVLVGFSLGGMVNRRVGMDHPDRVAGLVVIASPHKRSPEAQRLVEERAAATARYGMAATIDVTLDRWFTPEFRDDQPEVVADVRRRVLATDGEALSRARHVLATGVDELVQPDPPPDLPLLVMTGEHDSGSTPDMARAIATEAPAGEIVIVPGVRHLGLLETPDRFADPLVHFLAGSGRLPG